MKKDKTNNNNTDRTTKTDEEIISDIRNMIKRKMRWTEEKVDLWFKTINPMFGNVAPQEFIDTGRVARLLKAVRACINE